MDPQDLQVRFLANWWSPQLGQFQSPGSRAWVLGFLGPGVRLSLWSDCLPVARLRSFSNRAIWAFNCC